MLLLKDAINSFIWAWQAEKLLAKNTVDAYLKDLTIFEEFLKKEFSPAQDTGNLMLRLTTPPGSSLEYTDQKTKELPTLEVPEHADEP